MENLSKNIHDEYVRVISINLEKEIKQKLNNIGIFENNIIYVKKTSHNKKMIHIVVYNTEYVFRLADVQNIIVEKIAINEK